jgi:hypothetical protein
MENVLDSRAKTVDVISMLDFDSIDTTFSII